ncbi:hypothetical protein D9615_010448 [Tricholomella constricta]|uniref:NADH:flavin oxidoreductase/NADH oxidase N-terminal domain-containing protein n=1 Tax=Tricholomella constricta TaxID=117010 RepID=A0A8H5LRG3_9AGAR|nr:hypothetical protein D9615_010448 [Tricholomella constricta]
MNGEGDAKEEAGRDCDRSDKGGWALEVVEAVVKRAGESRAAIRFSPWSTAQGMGMRDPKPTFGYVVGELRRRFLRLSYILVVEPRVSGVTTLTHVPEGQSNDFIREIWASSDGVHDRRLINAGGYNRNLGIAQADAKGDLPVIAYYGRPFIANVAGFAVPSRKGRAVGDWGSQLCYRYGSLDPKGYTDYPPAGEDTAWKDLFYVESKPSKKLGPLLLSRTPMRILYMYR